MPQVSTEPTYLYSSMDRLETIIPNKTQPSLS